MAIEEKGKKSRKNTPRHRCQICRREIEDSVGIDHIKAEEYLIQLIRRDHPEWEKDKNTCDLCLEYYRELIKRAEL